MHIPLSIRLIALITLAWRLIIMAKKPNPLELKPRINLENIPLKKAVYLIDETINTDAIKNIYREKVRTYESDSQENMLIFLFISIEKEYRKAGIFRFLWFQPSHTQALYQSFVKTQYTEAQWALKDILMAINQDACTAFETENNTPETDDFMPEGGMSKDLFEAFDRVFDLEVYLKKISWYVNQF